MKEKEEVKLKGCKAGLGLKIVGGRSIAGEVPGETEHVGIFIKDVIPNSIAAKSGRLHQGDQILQANGENLRGVSNERAVGILKAQTATNSITLLISRDAKSQSDYRRLSTSLGLERKSNAPTIPAPMATSTPVVRDSIQSEDPDTRPSSSVSEFTHISTTDFSTSHDEDMSEPHHGGRDSPDYHQPQLHHHHGSKIATSGDSQVALSDVEVLVPAGPMVHRTGRPLSASSDHPPPLPLSSPPGEDDVTEDASVLPPLFKKVVPAKKMADTTVTPLKKNAGSTHLSKIIINKKRGLGIAVAGGVNKPDGPHIYIKSLMDGMDAATDGQLQVKDRIISINEEMFIDVTIEDAKTLLNKFKIRNVKSYDITFERVGDLSISPPISLPQPPRTDAASFFSSSTPPAKVPGVYYDIPSSEERPETSQQVVTKRPTPLHHKEPAPRTDSLHHRLSMKPSAKVKLEKLEWALKYMGYDVTPEQSQLMRSRLDVDDHGKVVFLDFVKCAKDIFAFRLEETSIEANLVYALTQKEDINMPLYPRDIDSYQPEMVERVSPLLLPSEPQVPRKDFDAMRKELHRRGEELDQKKRLQMSSDGETFEQVRKNGISPPRDASEVYSDDTNELQRQLAIIECQRKKEEAKAKRYEVTTEKLLSFVENCYEALVKSPEADKILYYPQGRGESVIRGNQVTGNPRPPQYLSRHAKVTSTTLAKEAKETIVAVRKILDASVLPYGWEEAYTVDGQKYYKNHEHQKTSWEHPLSSMNSNVSSQASSSSRSTPQPAYP